LKKPSEFSKKSQFRCKCGKFIKQNVVDRKLDGDALLCYKCHKAAQRARGHQMK